MRHIRVALDASLASADALCGAVTTACRLRGGPVNLNQHRVIDLSAERRIDRGHIRPMTVSRDLDAVGEARREIVNELLSGVGVAVSNVPAGDKLRVGVGREPQPRIAGCSRRLGFLRGVLLLGADEAPNFIDLESLTGKVLKHAVLIPGRRLAHVHDELAHSRLADAGQARDGADAHALAEKVDDLSALVAGQPVHTDRYT